MFAEALAKFLAPIVREIARVVIEEWRRPAEGEMIGGGDEVSEDVRDAIDAAFDHR